MSSDSATNDSTDLEETRTAVDAVERDLPRRRERVEERLAVIHDHIDDFEETDSEQEERDIVERIEAELRHLREEVDSEVEKDKRKLHDMIDTIEQKVKGLR